MEKHLDNCPHCGANLIGDPIPQAHRKAYGHATHFHRQIGQYDQILDRTVSYICPDCGGVWKA